MRKLLLTLLGAAMWMLHGYAQAPAIAWQKSLGGTSDDIPSAIIQARDGGYVAAGITMSTDGDVTVNHGQNDEWIVKLSSTGTLQWQTSLGGSNQDKAKAIMQMADGGYMVCGYTFSTDGEVTGQHGFYDYWLLRLDSGGVLQWEKCLGGTLDDQAYAMQPTREGGLVMAGKAKSYNGDLTGNFGGYDVWVVKSDDTGHIEWQHSYGGTNDDIALSIKQTADGGYIVAGGSESNDSMVTGNHGNSDIWVLKLDSIGTLQWERSFGGSDSDCANSVYLCRDGGYLVAGVTFSNDGDVTANHGGADFWLLKLDSAGSLLWQKTLGGSHNEFAFSVEQTTDDGFFMVGYSFSNDGDVSGHHGDSTTGDFWVLKTDSAGTLEWETSLGGTDMDLSTSYSNPQTSDGGYIVTGASASVDGEVTGHHGAAGVADYWVVKLGGTTGVEALTGADFAVYPNPGSGVLMIESQQPMSGDIHIDIVNTLGRQVYADDQRASGGVYKKRIALDLAEGIYYLSLQSDEGRMTKKVEVIR
jgi:hypothetical protein